MTGLYLIFPSALALSIALCINNLTKLEIDRLSTSHNSCRLFLVSAGTETEMRLLLLMYFYCMEVLSIHYITYKLGVLHTQYDECLLMLTHAYFC